jgi:protein-L-isoaspartate(D-aspartate) O-methyltransferase
MNYEQARFNMVEQQLRPAKVLNTDVLEVLFVVKREEFVPPAYHQLAFADTQIPLGGTAGACMFSPRVEALALQALAMTKHQTVLEIGTGSGYMAALLGAHADHVWSIEIDPELAATARENLRRAGVTNVSVEVGNGLAGSPGHAPYDAIMISGALDKVPVDLRDQLKPGGRLFVIEGAAPAMQAVLYTRTGADFTRLAMFETVVAPLRDVEPAAQFVF